MTEHSSQQHDKIVLELLCCVMIADGKATRHEKNHIIELMTTSGSTWNAEQIAGHIGTFVNRVRTDGFNAALNEVCGQTESLKDIDKLAFVKNCVDLARTDSTQTESEARVVIRIEAAIARASSRAGTGTRSHETMLDALCCVASAGADDCTSDTAHIIDGMLELGCDWPAAMTENHIRRTRSRIQTKGLASVVRTTCNRADSLTETERAKLLLKCVEFAESDSNYDVHEGDVVDSLVRAMKGDRAADRIQESAETQRLAGRTTNTLVLFVMFIAVFLSYAGIRYWTGSDGLSFIAALGLALILLAASNQICPNCHRWFVAKPTGRTKNDAESWYRETRCKFTDWQQYATRE